MNDFLSGGFKNHDVSRDKSFKKTHKPGIRFIYISTSLVEMGLYIF